MSPPYPWTWLALDDGPEWPFPRSGMAGLSPFHIDTMIEAARDLQARLESLEEDVAIYGDPQDAEDVTLVQAERARFDAAIAWWFRSRMDVLLAAHDRAATK